jgi:hypothetical protein
MKNNENSDKMLEKATEVYEELKRSDHSSLTKEEVLSVLGDEYIPYYSYIVTGLASIKKIRKKTGRTGGIELNTGKAIQDQITDSNQRTLGKYFSGLGVNFSSTKNGEKSSLESSLYEPLKEYLEEMGIYNLVENRANLRSGNKWENADLVAAKYTQLTYHVGIFPKLTCIEVKSVFPSITDIQQTASYLRYCNSAYLCFFDREFTGKNYDDLTTKVRDEGVWDLASTFEIGLIVAYHPQERSKKTRFLLLKEAPDTSLDPTAIEEGIDLLVSDFGKKELTEALNKQIVKFLSQKKGVD